MNLTDNSTFVSAFRRLSGALNRKWTANDFQTTVAVYFDALQAWDLDDVLAAELVLRSRKTWPKVGDWIAVLPIIRPPSDGARVMRTSEVEDYQRALRLHYEDAPCPCGECVGAGVTDLPLRFVPDFTAEDVEAKAFCPALNRIVVSGHWAHGTELRRWYAAKARFAASAPGHYRAIVSAILEREPGEDDGDEVHT